MRRTIFLTLCASLIGCGEAEQDEPDPRCKRPETTIWLCVYGGAYRERCLDGEYIREECPLQTECQKVLFEAGEPLNGACAPFIWRTFCPEDRDCGEGWRCHRSEEACYQVCEPGVTVCAVEGEECRDASDGRGPLCQPPVSR